MLFMDELAFDISFDFRVNNTDTPTTQLENMDKRKN